MTRRYFGPGPRAAGDVWTAVLMAIAVGAIIGAVVWGGGTVELRVVYPTATPATVPTGTAEPGDGPEGAVEPVAVPSVFPPVETLIRHYFGPLGAVDVALAVYECEGAGGPPWVGAVGELGPFQLQPDGGAGERFEDAGWDLMDPRENVMAAALLVAAEGWWAFEACYPEGSP